MTAVPTAVSAAAAATVEGAPAEAEEEEAEAVEAVDDIELEEADEEAELPPPATPLLAPAPLLMRMLSNSSRILSCSIICFSC